MKQKGEGGGGGGNKLGRWLGAPVRALSRACDSYVRKMSACAGHMPTQYAGAVGGRGGGFGAPGAMQAAMFSSRSTRRGGGDDEDVNDLVRAMSQRDQGAGGGRATPDVVAMPPRSRSVAVGRIDEDAPCEFVGADAARVGSVMPPSAAVRRSRSVAVGSSGGAGLAARAGAGAGGFGATKKGGAGFVVHGA